MDMATKESMMDFISKSPKETEYVPYVSDTDSQVDTAPKLEILSCPTLVNKKLVVVSGTLKDDASREPRLFVNQKEAAVRGDKWLVSVPVVAGINHVIVTAVNNTGKIVFSSHDIFCGLLPPRLEVDDMPELTSKPYVTISGTVFEPNPGVSQIPEVSINDNALEVDENGKWSYSAQTRDGENIFVITAKNSAKMSAIVRRTFIKAPDMPEFCLTKFPESSRILLPEISGTLIPAQGAKFCFLRVNDQDIPVSSNGSFSTKIKLKQSDTPPITFTVTSNSKYIVEKQIKFDPPPPVNTITKCEPAQKRILYRISGVATDATGAISSVSLNGKEAALNKGSWNMVITVKFGFTPIVVITKNSFGKTSALLGSIYLEPQPPELKITDCPDTVKAAGVNVSGTVKDHDGEMPPVVFVNNTVANVKGENWDATIPLIPGSVNTIKVSARSDTGKSTEVEAQINCTLVIPTLKVLNCPRETDSPELILRGFARSNFIEDQNNVKVFVNRRQIDFADGKWTHAVTLNKGTNTFLIEVENKEGERVEEEKTVVLL